MGGKVWDGNSSGPELKDIHISDGLFTDTPSPGAHTISAQGLTIIPGLIEAHAHLCFNGKEDWRAVYDNDTPSSMLLRMIDNSHKMLRAGITTVRDLGAPTDLAISLRDSIDQAVVSGPSLIVAGAPITPTGGHCYFMGGEADGELGVRVAVRERVRSGVDWIKVMASGGNMTPGTNVERAQYTQPEMRAIVEEAHRLGVRVTAHAHGVEGIRHALAGGVDMLEHCSFQTPDGSEPVPEVIQEIAETGTIVSPTIFGSLWGQENTQQYKKRATLTQDLIESGARMLMSTDCGIPHTPHENLSYSLEIMQNLSGLEPLEVLQLSTSRSAELLGLPARGRIEPGLRADIVALSSDPTDKLSALRDIEFVVCGGDQIPT